MDKKIVNDVLIEKSIDSNGSEITHFKPIEIKEDDSFWNKVKGFFKKKNVSPYVAFKDLNNSEDEPFVNKPKTACEIGIRIDF